MAHENLPAPSIAYEQTVKREQMAVYERVLDRLFHEELRFMLGGAFAMAAYTGYLRNTKDLDLYCLPEDRQHFRRVTEECGLQDYFAQTPYDRSWIYRSYEADTIVDVIWAFANQVALVDEHWFSNSRSVIFGARPVSIVPAEELIWAKLYVFQRDRCDWPDLLNLLFYSGAALNWSRLLERLGSDAPLLGALLSLFVWVAPGQAASFPEWIWPRLGLLAPHPSAQDMIESRINLLESRPWFIAKEAA